LTRQTDASASKYELHDAKATPAMSHQPAPDAQATRVSTEALDRAYAAAAEFAARLTSRRTDSGAPVRNTFVTSIAGEVPPLAALLRGGGRGGQLRVKLYLSLLWVCTAPPFDASYPARAWASLLGLEHPDTKGARRIQEAIRDLAQRGFITVRDRGGLPSVIRLLDESGNSEPYTAPSKTYNALKASRAPQETLRRHQYFKIPSAAWTGTYLAQLGGPGTAMLAVLCCEQRGGGEVWFTPNVAQKRFHLAPATRTVGLQQLRRLGLIETRKASVSHDGSFISFQRLRNVHTLTFGQPDLLASHPPRR
jgi:hypothetical protein